MKRRLLRQLAIPILAIGVCADTPLLAASFPAASPEEQGISGLALEAIASTVKGYCDRDIIVGGTLVVSSRSSITR